MTGRTFGRLTVVQRDTSAKTCKWLCRCSCGTKKSIYLYHLLKGSVVSCGCHSRDQATKHGHAKGGKWSPEYFSWMGMRQRCLNPNTKGYENYGGRGITVCAHWRDSFEQFLADMGPRPKGKTLDRRDNDKGYWCPLCCQPIGNCHWATWREQLLNRRNREAIYAAHSEKMKNYWTSLTKEQWDIAMAELTKGRDKRWANARANA